MTNGSTKIHLVGAHYEVTNGVVTKYYFAGAQRIAVRKNGTLSYILTDHLGSTSMTTNASGAMISEMKYKAWGEPRFASGTSPTKYTYTGQYSNVSDFGLMFYNARWYDPVSGRFNQPDSIIPEQSQGTQAWDRFAYTNNNPVRYTDPTGHCAIICGAIVGAIVGVAIVGANQLLHSESVHLTLADYGKAALVGAAAGALISTGVGLGAGTALGATLLGAGTGAAGSAIGYTLASGSEYNSDEMMANAAIGGVAGAATGYVGGLNAGLSGKMLQAEISMLSGAAQMTVSSYYDDDWPTTPDLLGAGVVGGLSFGATQVVKPISLVFGPILGPTIGESLDDVLRAGFIEAWANDFQDYVDEQNDPR